MEVTCEHPPTCLAPHQNLDTSPGTTCLQPGGEAFRRALTLDEGFMMGWIWKPYIKVNLAAVQAET